jgi:ribosome biogenesis GTPase A
VGKSSLINMLTQNKQLAKVSKSPGAGRGCGVGAERVSLAAATQQWSGAALDSSAGAAAVHPAPPRGDERRSTHPLPLGACCTHAGATKTIVHFLINDSWYLVDLPGYG